MPGHMNVLLAEANVPYPQLNDMEEVNPEFPHGRRGARRRRERRHQPGRAPARQRVSGMPILDVDHARSVVVIKRSMGHGYAGIDNELYTDPRPHAVRRRQGGAPGQSSRPSRRWSAEQAPQLGLWVAVSAAKVIS